MHLLADIVGRGSAAGSKMTDSVTYLAGGKYEYKQDTRLEAPDLLEHDRDHLFSHTASHHARRLRVFHFILVSEGSKGGINPRITSAAVHVLCGRTSQGYMYMVGHVGLPCMGRPTTDNPRCC